MIESRPQNLLPYITTALSKLNCIIIYFIHLNQKYMIINSFDSNIQPNIRTWKAIKFTCWTNWDPCTDRGFVQQCVRGGHRRRGARLLDHHLEVLAEGGRWVVDSRFPTLPLMVWQGGELTPPHFLLHMDEPNLCTQHPKVSKLRRDKKPLTEEHLSCRFRAPNMVHYTGLFRGLIRKNCNIILKTLPKALGTQALTAFTSNFGLVGLVQYDW